MKLKVECCCGSKMEIEEDTEVFEVRNRLRDWIYDHKNCPKKFNNGNRRTENES